MMNIKKILSFILCLSVLAGAGALSFAEEAAVPSMGTDENGIIDAEYLRKTIEEYAEANNMRGGKSEFSVGYVYTATGDSWFYNGDAWYYSASLYKVPVAMLLEEKELAGEISRDTVIQSQYATDTVDQMEFKSIVYSNNYTGHAMVEYLGGSYNGKCSDQTIKFTPLPESYFDQNFFDVSYYSARYYTEILRTIYNNQDKYPHIIDYMKQANDYMCANPNDIGAYLSGNGIGDRYQVAQKYGSYVEAQGKGDDNKHAAAIIYTPNPVIITVMTKNIANYEKKIGGISSILVDYTLSLDDKIEAYKAEKLRLEQEAAEAAARQAEEEARIAAAKEAAEEAARQAAEEAARQAEEQARKEAIRQKLLNLALIVGGVVLGIAVVAVLAIKLKNSGGFSRPKKNKGKKLNDYYFDEYEEDNEEYNAEEDEDYSALIRIKGKAQPKQGKKISVPSPAKAISVFSGAIAQKAAELGKKAAEEEEKDYYPTSDPVLRRATSPKKHFPAINSHDSFVDEQEEVETVYDDVAEDMPAEPVSVRKPMKSTVSHSNGKYIPKH